MREKRSSKERLHGASDFGSKVRGNFTSATSFGETVNDLLFRIALHVAIGNVTGVLFGVITVCVFALLVHTGLEWSLGACTVQEKKSFMAIVALSMFSLLSSKWRGTFS